MAHTVARKLISSKVDLMSTKHGFMPASVLPIPMAVRNISKPASLPFQMDYRSCLSDWLDKYHCIDICMESTGKYWIRRLALAVSMRKQRIDTIRLKLLKIAARVVRSARYKYFKLCSSCPYKKEFYETLENIRNLQPQLE